uniref:Choline transporter-like protein n=1 Tax=Pygocentrus nattereri TaxID=42514 RepID=A0AAR2K787_PYGNA
VICCVLFMAAIVGYMTIGVLAWLFGDPRHVFFSRNSTGMFCGAGVNINEPNVFYIDILKCDTETNEMATTLKGHQCPTTQVCVKECPSEFWKLPPEAYASDALPKDFFQQKYCDPSLDLVHTTLVVLHPSVLKQTDPECFPLFSTLNNSLVSGLNSKSVGVRVFEDFATSWYWILIGLLAAMIISVVFMLLMRYWVSLLVWLLIVGVLAVGAYGIYHCYWEYNNYRHSKLTLGDLGFNSKFSVYLQVKETWLAFLVILCLVELVLLLLLKSLGNKISNALALLEESSRAVSYVMSTLAYPLVTFILLVVCVCYWGVTSLYPLSPVLLIPSNCHSITGLENCLPQTFNALAYSTCPTVHCVFFKYDDEGFFQRNAAYLQIFNVLAFLWCVNFIIALGQCTLASTFATFYWAFSKPDNIPPYPLLQAFIWTLRYHVGSMAFGAVILTLFEFPRIFLEYLDHKFRDCQNSCCRFVKMSLKCCFWFLNKFLKFVNRNTYIMIAVYGDSFCVSAKNAYMLLMRNIGRVVILNNVTNMLLFFGKLLVAGSVGILATAFFSGHITLPDATFQAELLHYYWVPIIMVAVGAYLIAQGFFSVYSMCIDTLFLCFLDDLERNNGTTQRPYYMSRSLMRILHQSEN